MVIRETKVQDFSKIDNLQKKYKLRSIKNYKNKILKNYNSYLKKFPMGWVIEDKGVIRGFVANILKSYKYNNKKLLCAVSNSLVVDKNYRQFTINLMRKFFGQRKIDFFLNTTPNEATYKIWKKMGSKDIPQETIHKKLIYVFNTKKTLNFFFQRKKIKIPGLMVNLSSLLLKKSLIKKINIKFNYNYILKRSFKLDKKLKNFITNRQDKNKLELIRNNSWFELNYNNNLKQKSFLFVIYKQKKIVGFCGLIENNIEKFNLRRLSLCDIIVDRNNPQVYKFLFFKLFNMSELKKYDLIEMQGFADKCYKNLKKYSHLTTRIKNFSYLYKNSKTSNNKIFDKRPTWKISLIDGDNLI